MVITARDVCPYCGHLWDGHDTDNPTITDLPCGCCVRVGERVNEVNRGISR